MVIREGDNSIEFEVVDRVAAHLPTPGDVEFCVAIESNQFRGHGFAWVNAPTLTAFLEQLRELESCRRGSAAMEGMSPGVFRLRIWSIDRRGHIAIAGMIARDINKGEAGPYRHALEFGFELDPTSLPSVLARFVKMIEGNEIRESAE